MRVLLVQLPTSHHGAGEKVYPLGLSRLSSLVPSSCRKAVFDMNLSPDPWPALYERLAETAPDRVFLSLRNIDPLAGHQVSYLSSLVTAAKMVRKVAPAAVIFAGGPAFSLFGQRLMEAVPELDCGLVGEGENVMESLLVHSFDPATVCGLLWRKGGKIIRNPAGPKVDMNALPPMDLSMFNPLDYTEGNSYVAAVGIEGKRGCDLACGYCVYPCLGGGRMRLRDPKKIVDEMEALHRDFGIGLFHFTDSVVNRPQEHFEELVNQILKRKLSVGWTGFFREESLTERSIDRAVRAGLVAIYFSADALTDHGLKLLNKRLEKRDILNAARTTAACGILTMCHFLVNLPEETDAHQEEAWEMLDRLLAIHGPAGNLGAMIFNHVRLYPGAPLTRRLIKNGMLSPTADLLYPVYHNPECYAGTLHEMEAHCHAAGVFSRIGVDLPGRARA